MSKADESDFDIFIRNSIYPESEGIFSFRPKPLKDIKDECIVVLDTNSLLVPYTTGKDSLEQISLIYSSLVKGKRLVVPGQVAREFAEHRVTKIKELYQQISRKQAKIGLGSYPLLDNISEYQKALELEKQLNDLIREYNKTITGILDVIGDWYWDDPVSKLYGELFAANVVLDPDFNNEKTKERLEKDNLYKLPPGYKDARKNDEGIGDLLIWQTILEVGKTSNKSVIFVSLDQKPDWWSQAEGRPLYPRYELIDEFRRVSQGQSLHILKFSSFLDLYGATADVVEEVRKEETQAIIESVEFIFSEFDVPNAIFKWLLRQNPEDVRFAQSLDGIDIIRDNTDGTLTGVVFQYFQTSKSIKPRLRKIIQHLQRLSEAEIYSSFLLVLVANDPVLFNLIRYISNMNIVFPKLVITVGTIMNNGSFEDLFSRVSS